MDSLPNFITHGAPLRAHKSSANIFSTVCALIGYFKITWHLAMKLFPAKMWAGNIATSMTSQGNSALLPANVRASGRSREKKSNFAGFLGTYSWKNQPISQEFHGSFRSKIHQKAIGKKWPILWLFSRQILLEIDRFCADQTSVFNVFLTEVIICSYNNNTLQKWTNGKAFNIMASAKFLAT